MDKKIILLVGPMGSGKTTFCENKFPKYLRISQDEQGKKEHFKIFLKAIKEKKERIIIDRINHLKIQRKKYLKLGKKNGYKTEIIVLSEKFKTCYERIKNRKNHPNLNNKTNSNNILNALRMYFKTYEIPISNEADKITFLNEFDPYILDLSKKNFKNFLIIGDVHGCYDELIELINIAKNKCENSKNNEENKNNKDNKNKSNDENKENYNKDKSNDENNNNINNYNKDNSKNNDLAIIFVGDLVDKGNKIREVINLYGNLKNTYSVMGNHEEKLIRYLRGNNITINFWLDKTIKQLKLEDINTEFSKNLLFELESFPYIIKLSKNDYVLHAGINPFKNIKEQSRYDLLHLRKLKPENFKFLKKEEFWFNYYDENKENIYFGHQLQEKIKIKKNIFSLDGNCVYGGELRAILLKKQIKNNNENLDNQDINKINFNKKKKNIKKEDIKINNNKENRITTNFKKEYIKISAKKEYFKLNEIKSEINPKLKIFEDLVEKNYLKKVESKDLVIYNYTRKCVYEGFWNENTIISRGIIFEKDSGDIIGRPFPKFFNLDENKNSLFKNLPENLKYSVYEKIDGSLGIIFFYNNKWNITTRGDFFSIQAEEAKKILKKYNLKNLNKEFTYLVEIIYPENKIIIDYKEKRELILLAGINTKNSNELDYKSLIELSKKTNFPLIKKYDYTIKNIIELKKNLPKNKEGFVIKFENNLRIKIKGDEYLKLNKIILNISPISLWEVMENGKINQDYLKEIPEEILPEIIFIKKRLEKEYKIIKNEIEKEYKIIKNEIENKSQIIKNKYDEKLNKITEKEKFKKNLGIYLKKEKNQIKFKHFQIFFSFFTNNNKRINRYILKIIRPNSNELKKI